MDDSSRRRLSQSYANLDYTNQQLMDALNKYVLSQEKNLSDWEGRQVALAGELKINTLYDKAFAKIEEQALESLEDEAFVEELVTIIVKLEHAKQSDDRINDEAKQQVDGLGKRIDEMTASLKKVSDMIDAWTPPASKGEVTGADVNAIRKSQQTLRKHYDQLAKEHDECRTILNQIQSYYIGMAEHRVFQQLTLTSITDRMQERRDEGDNKQLKRLHEDAYNWSYKCREYARTKVDELEDHELEAEKKLEMSQSSRRERFSIAEK